jgi:hypothetical protein
MEDRTRLSKAIMEQGKIAKSSLTIMCQISRGSDEKQVNVLVYISVFLQADLIESIRLDGFQMFFLLI